MAYSYKDAVGDGSTTVFNTPVYLSKTHIYVTVDEVDTEFTWVTDSTISISPAPALGSAVHVYRSTPLDRVINFQNQNILTEGVLDYDSNQLMYIVQEFQEWVGMQVTADAVDSAEAADLSAQASEQSAANAKESEQKAAQSESNTADYEASCLNIVSTAASQILTALLSSQGADLFAKLDGDNTFQKDITIQGLLKANLTADSTIGGKKIWHSGNDGTGSGLAADTVDGYHVGQSGDITEAHIPIISSDGVLELGKYIDFHDPADGKDYCVRLTGGTSGKLLINDQYVVTMNDLIPTYRGQAQDTRSWTISGLTPGKPLLLTVATNRTEPTYAEYRVLSGSASGSNGLTDEYYAIGHSDSHGSTKPSGTFIIPSGTQVVLDVRMTASVCIMYAYQ